MHADDPRLNFIGLRPTGDLADLTSYTTRTNRTTWFPKSPPLKPPSVLQTRQRNRFRLAAQAWKRLEQGQRDDWNLACVRARLMLHGYTLWIYYQLTRDTDAIHTIEQQTGLQLLPT